MLNERVYILGAGAIGLPLAAYLRASGRDVLAVRTSTDTVDAHDIEIAVTGMDGTTCQASIVTVSLAKLQRLEGIIVVAAKSYANSLIAARLKDMDIRSPVVILQNGVGVEEPYLTLNAPLYRCVLYATGQKNGINSYKFAPVNASAIGAIRGNEQEASRLVETLSTPAFPFVLHGDIRREVWKKAIANAVFNSVCPLLEVDNGIFIRNDEAAALAREIVDECILITRAMDMTLTADEIMQQLFAISKKSDGQLISTLQDINEGRETEIEYLNVEIARRGETLTPPVKAHITKALGEMVKIKSKLTRTSLQRASL